MCQSTPTAPAMVDLGRGNRRHNGANACQEISGLYFSGPAQLKQTYTHFQKHKCQTTVSKTKEEENYNTIPL
jgi:hypothetical protein